MQRNTLRPLDDSRRWSRFLVSYFYPIHTAYASLVSCFACWAVWQMGDLIEDEHKSFYKGEWANLIYSNSIHARAVLNPPNALIRQNYWKKTYRSISSMRIFLCYFKITCGNIRKKYYFFVVLLIKRADKRYCTKCSEFQEFHFRTNEWQFCKREKNKKQLTRTHIHTRAYTLLSFQKTTLQHLMW